MRRILFCVMVLFLIIACEAPQQPAADAELVDNTTQSVTADGITLAVKVGKEVYSPGEEISVIATITNPTKEAISYTRATACEPDMHIYIDIPRSDRIYLEEPDYLPIGCVKSIDKRALVPAQAISRAVVWDQLLPTTPQKQPAFPGRYPIITVFSYEIDSKPKQMTVINTVEIRGESAITISKDRAIKIAFSDPAVISWYDSHLGKAMVEEEYGKFYYVTSRGRDRLENKTAQEILASEPVLEVLFTGSAWEVTLWSEHGEEPRRLKVRIDAASGRILEIRKLDMV